MADKVDNKKKWYVDLNTFFELQTELHINNKEHVPIRFMTEIRKTPWSAIIRSRMHREEQKNADQAHAAEYDELSSETMAIYTANNKYDILSYSYLTTWLPRIRVADEYQGEIRISWTQNLFHHIISAANIVIKKDDAVGFGENVPAWLDNWKQVFMKAGKGMAELYDQLIGNRSFLINWNSELPSFPIACPQPWFYAESDKKAIHLHLIPETDAFAHRYKFRLNIGNFLRMQGRIKNDDGTLGDWKSIRFDPVYLDKASQEAVIPTPHMWGFYSVLTQEELEFHQTWTHNYLATNITTFKPPNDQGSGKVVVQVETTMPVMAFYHIAQNVKARELNNLSNYSTAVEHSEMDKSDWAWPPVKTVTMRYAGAPVQKHDFLQTGALQHWYHSNSAPRDVGYGMITTSYQPGGLDPDIGLVCSKDTKIDLVFDINSVSLVRSQDDSDRDIDSRQRIRAALDRQAKKQNTSDQSLYDLNILALSFNKLRLNYKKGVIIEDGVNSKLIPEDKHFPGKHR